MTDRHLMEQTQSSQKLLSGHFLQVFRDTVVLPDEQLAVREYVIHPGAVMVIPLIETICGEIRVVLERQYRYPVKQVMIEFPAGKLDAGEDTLVCAQRELREETGYSAAECGCHSSRDRVFDRKNRYLVCTRVEFGSAAIGQRRIPGCVYRNASRVTAMVHDRAGHGCQNRIGRFVVAKCALW